VYGVIALPRQQDRQLEPLAAVAAHSDALVERDPDLAIEAPRRAAAALTMYGRGVGDQARGARRRSRCCSTKKSVTSPLAGRFGIWHRKTVARGVGEDRGDPDRRPSARLVVVVG
jgi:hypothetical protein